MLGVRNACHRARGQEYEGKKFKNVATGDLELPEDEAEKQRLEEQRQAYAGLCALMKEVLGDKVEKACPPLTPLPGTQVGLARVEVTYWQESSHLGRSRKQVHCEPCQGDNNHSNSVLQHFVWVSSGARACKVP